MCFTILLILVILANNKVTSKMYLFGKLHCYKLASSFVEKYNQYRYTPFLCRLQLHRLTRNRLVLLKLRHYRYGHIKKLLYNYSNVTAISKAKFAIQRNEFQVTDLNQELNNVTCLPVNVKYYTLITLGCHWIIRECILVLNIMK